MKIVKGDIVYLRSGKDVSGKDAASRKAVRGKVIRNLSDGNKVVVEGLNMVTKHQRPRATGGAGQVQQGGRIQMEAPLPVSRVMLVCPNCDKPTRVGMRLREEQRQTLNGTKTVTVRDRVCKQCGEIIKRPTEQS